MKDRKPNGRSRFWLGRLPRQRFQEADGLPKNRGEWNIGAREEVVCLFRS